MKIQIQILSEKYDASEFFGSIDEAQEWMENFRDDDFDEDEGMEYEDTASEATRIRLSTISLSKSLSDYNNSLNEFLNDGYEITYDGKTGVTLELKDRND